MDHHNGEREDPLDSTHTHALESQVGGHAGVMTTEDGSLLIKPALARELEFYQQLQRNSTFEELRAFIPKFLGTLKLEGQVDVDPARPHDSMMEVGGEGIIVKPVADQKATSQPQKALNVILINNPYPQSIVLENLSYRFLKPNILDIKLGTVLYDENASEEKVARMLKAARETTSFETGVRLTGFQVYDNITSQPVNTPKSYGKSIKPHQLGEGIAKFFPVAVPPSSSSINADADANDNGASSVSSPGGEQSVGLLQEHLVPILRAIREEVAIIKDVFSETELRMVGGSLLIIYEGDWERAQAGIKHHLAGDDNEDENQEEEDDEEEDDEDDDETSSKRPGPPFVVKLIDFAHTQFVPGQGPDEGVLLGMDTVLKLFDARLREITFSQS